MEFSKEFITCQKGVGIAEGGWADSPNDKGKETLFGVSRRWNPVWPGWIKVDAYAARLGRGSKAFILAVNSDAELKQLSYNLFFTNYWIPIQGDYLPLPVARIIYDMSINSGPFEACELLGKVAADLGCTEKPAHKLMPGQIKFIKAFYDSDKAGSFTKQLLLKRLSFYMGIVAKDQTQKANWHSWMSRLQALAKETLGDAMKEVFK